MFKRVFKITFLASSILLSYKLYGLPQGGDVISGSAAIQQPDTSTLLINQSTDKAIINWNQFNINTGELTQFVVPTNNSITLNRVIGASPSEILGALKSNGQVWLINPNGIIFGSNAQVNVAGLVASTLNIQNEDFLKGNYQLRSGDNAASSNAQIINQGTIVARDTGVIALLAPQVQNQGILVANLGTVAIGTGNQVTLNFAGNQLLNFSVSNGVASDFYDTNGNRIASLSNTGKIIANGGAVLLTAQNVDQVLNQSINTSGAISQSGALSVTGATTLKAGGNNITLSNASNSFGGAVTIGSFATIAGNVTITAGSGGLTLAQAGAAPFSSLIASTTGTFTAGSDLPTSTSLGGTGNLSLTGSTVTLGSNNISSVNNLSITETGSGVGFAIGSNITTANGLSVTTNNGAISQTSALTVAGASTFNAGTSTITLNNASNAFGGIITVGPSSGTSGVVTLNANSSGLTIAQTAGGTLGSLNLTTANGAIAQSGALTISGMATLNSGTADTTLNTSTNSLGGISVTANNATITNNLNNGLIIGTSNVANNYTLNTRGNIVQSGAQSGPLSVGNIFNLTTGSAWSLGNVSNVFNTIQLTTTGSLSTNFLTNSGTGTLTLGNINVGGFNIASAGAIVQSGTVNATGNVGVLQGTSITLNNTLPLAQLL